LDVMARSLDKGERGTLSDVGPFHDSSAVRIVGEDLAFPHSKAVARFGG